MTVKKTPCPVCGNEQWAPFLETTSGRIMTGDQRIIPGYLKKVGCGGCGVVANLDSFSREDIEQLYGQEYILNTLGREEHRFFTPSGPVSRSRTLFDWITPWLPESFESFLEIGCGEGNLLIRFHDAFPGKKISGIEGSIKACALAENKGLDVTCRMILSKADRIFKSDVILAVAVLEHIEKMEAFLSVLKAGLHQDGRLIFVVPIQNYTGYDIFFAEHVWHMTTAHFKALFEQNGLKCIHVDDAHAINHGMGLFVLEKNETSSVAGDLSSEARFAMENRDQWLNIFSQIDTWAKKGGFKRIALFGSGEVATLFLTFTAISDLDVVACIDEDAANVGSFKHDIPIFGLNWLKNAPVDAILLAINPKYHKMVKEKLKFAKIKIGVWS